MGDKDKPKDSPGPQPQKNDIPDGDGGWKEAREVKPQE